MRKSLLQLLAVSACTSAAPPPPVVEPPPPVVTEVKAPAPPSYALVKDKGKDLGRLVATSASGVELFSRTDIYAFSAGHSGDLFVVSKAERAIDFLVERLDERGASIWKKAVPTKERYGQVALVAAAGQVTFVADRYGQGSYFWSLDAESGTPTVSDGTALSGFKIGFVDARAVVWTFTQERVVRYHPNGRVLSSQGVSVPPADPAKSVRVISLCRGESGGAFASTTDGFLVSLDDDGKLTSRQLLPEPALELIGEEGDRALRTRSYLLGLNGQGKPKWQWRAPSGEIIEARKQKDGGFSVLLSIGTKVALDPDGKITDAFTDAAWGDRKAKGLPVDLELAKVRHGQVGWRFDRVGGGASAQVQLVGGSGGAYQLPQLGSVERLNSAALLMETLHLTHGTKKLTKYPRGALSGNDLYILAATYEQSELDSHLLGADVYKLVDKKLVVEPNMSFKFEPGSNDEHASIAADADVLAACASGSRGQNSCFIKTKAGVTQAKLDRTVESMVVHSGAVYALVSDYQEETQVRLLQNGAWTDLGLRTRAPGKKLAVVSAQEIYVLAATDYGVDQSLFQFDGKGWSALPLPMANVRDLYAKGRDEVWVVGPAGVARWDGKSWTLADGPNSGTLRSAADGLNAITEGPNGTLVLQGTSGTWMGRPLGDKIVARDLTVETPWSETAVGDAAKLETAKSAQTLTKISIALNGDKTKAKRTLLTSVIASATAVDGTLWLADDESLFVVEDGAAKYVSGYQKKPWGAALAPVSRSRVGLVDGMLDASAAKNVTTPLGLAGVRTLATSPTGETWAAVLPSVNLHTVVLHSSKNGVYRHYADVPDWTFTAISVRADQDLWFVGGTPDKGKSMFDDEKITNWPVGAGGLAHFDGKQFTSHRVAAGSLVVVTATGDNEAWAGGAGGILAHAHAGKVEVYAPADPATGTIRTILSDGPASVWFAGDDRRVLHWDGKAFFAVDAPDLPRNTTFTTSFVHAGKVHLAGPSGIYRLD